MCSVKVGTQRRPHVPSSLFKLETQGILTLLSPLLG